MPSRLAPALAGLTGVALALALALLALSPAPPALAAEHTHHVSPAGDDGAAGTEQAPWRTLTHALRSLEAGDTLVVHAGEYRERVTDVRYAPGTPSRPVTVVAAPGARPLVRGVLEIRNAHHWTFDGVSVTWDDERNRMNDNPVKIMNGVGWTFRNATVSRAWSVAGVYIGTTVPGEPAHWRLLDSCVHDTRPTDRVRTDHNVYVANGMRAAPGLVEGNLFFGAPNGNNVKLGGSSPSEGGASNVRLAYNTMVEGGQNLLVAWGAHDNTIERNLFFNATGADWYPNVRGHELTGTGNVARANAGGAAARLLLSHESRTEIADAGGNHFPVNPGFSGGRGCDGLVAANPWYAYGHRSDARRVSGAGRVETAVELSRRSYPRPGTAGTVIIATAAGYADALAGGPLAAVQGGPLLLTGGDRLHPAVSAEVRRLGARQAYLLGGTAALSDQVARDLRALGVEVVRLRGRDRFHTAALAAQQVDSARVYVAEGAHADPRRGWPDAMSASAAAAAGGSPLLAVTRSAVPAATEEALSRGEFDEVVLVGGEQAISAEVARRVQEIVGPETDVRRLAGSDRYATSVAVAQDILEPGVTPPNVFLATGHNWPDALAAGAAAGLQGGSAVLLLVDGQDPRRSRASWAWLHDRRAGIERVLLAGGPGSISELGENEVAVLLR